MSVSSDVVSTLVTTIEYLLRVLTLEEGGEQWAQIVNAKNSLQSIRYDPDKDQIDLGQNDIGGVLPKP